MLWLNGKAVEGTVARFDLRDRGLLLGDGVFETVLVANGQMVFGERHLARLGRAAQVIGLRLPTLHAEAAAREIAEGSMRITVTRGPAPRGIAPPQDAVPQVIIAGFPGAPAALFKPLSLGTSAIRRNQTSPASRIKALNYLDTVLANQEVAADEALFLNTEDRVACGGTGNLWLLRGSQLLTPPLRDGVLDGITRAVLLELAQAVGLSAREAPITPEELQQADAVFLSNSLRLLAPVSAIDGVACGTEPERFEKLKQALLGRISDEIGPWRPQGVA